MNTKNVPALIMLFAGAVACIVQLICGVPTKRFLVALLIVLISFYIIGSIVKLILDKTIKIMEEEVDVLDDISFDSDFSIPLDDEEPSQFMGEENYVVEEKET